ncbi:hypothetical protein GWK48_00985 [Metallosphaera tengchongensis]|uniref:Uncharacterized protein n=1 Tax=Metallosphaera tengchongensis TaxID=1532350 RepID=A0A6N0NR02_9CREN|nr:hypothetical protein [Metallosphaera tengchongensis]QKQ99155.1 hypothetical protein GWK48_00985 [Metallosphaera tengchongensis]
MPDVGMYPERLAYGQPKMCGFPRLDGIPSKLVGGFPSDGQRRVKEDLFDSREAQGYQVI